MHSWFIGWLQAASDLFRKIYCWNAACCLVVGQGAEAWRFWLRSCCSFVACFGPWFRQFTGVWALCSDTIWARPRSLFLALILRAWFTRSQVFRPQNLIVAGVYKSKLILIWLSISDTRWIKDLIPFVSIGLLLKLQVLELSEVSLWKRRWSHLIMLIALWGGSSDAPCKWRILLRILLHEHELLWLLTIVLLQHLREALVWHRKLMA